jgi:hypothetical protein
METKLEVVLASALPSLYYAHAEVNPVISGREIERDNPGISWFVVAFDPETRGLVFFRFVVTLLDCLLCGCY